MSWTKREVRVAARGLPRSQASWSRATCARSLWRNALLRARQRADPGSADPPDQPADNERVLAHVWPLQHARIIPNGTYFLVLQLSLRV